MDSKECLNIIKNNNKRAKFNGIGLGNEVKVDFLKDI